MSDCSYSILLLVNHKINVDKFARLEDQIKSLKKNYNCIKLISGEMALNLISQNPQIFQIVILDLSTTDIPAQEMVSKILNLNIDIKIILLSDDLKKIKEYKSNKIGPEKVLPFPDDPGPIFDLIENNYSIETMVPLRLAILEKEKKYPVDIYISLGGGKTIKIFEKGEDVDRKRLDKLILRGLENLYIHNKEASKVIRKLYIPFRVSTFIINKTIPFAVYLPKNSDKKSLGRARTDSREFNLLFEANTIINSKHIEILYHQGITQAFIEDVDEHLYQRYLEDSMNSLMRSGGFASDEKALVASQYMKNCLRIVFSRPDEYSIQLLQSAQGHIHTFFSLNKDALKKLMAILKRGPKNIFNHSISVGSLSYALSLEITRLLQDDIFSSYVSEFKNCLLDTEVSRKTIFMGALLHDIGKAIMAFNLFAKNQQEEDSPILRAEIFRQHSTVGYELLKKVNCVEPQVLEIVFQHEEFCDGNGYPLGLVKNQISFHSQIISICNYFDNLLRVNKLSEYDALERIQDNRSKFNPQLIYALKCLIKNVNESGHQVIENINKEAV